MNDGMRAKVDDLPPVRSCKWSSELNTVLKVLKHNPAMLVQGKALYAGGLRLLLGASDRLYKPAADHLEKAIKEDTIPDFIKNSVPSSMRDEQGGLTTLLDEKGKLDWKVDFLVAMSVIAVGTTVLQLHAGLVQRLEGKATQPMTHKPSVGLWRIAAINVLVNAYSAGDLVIQEEVKNLASHIG